MRAILTAAALAALSIAGPATAASVFQITLKGVVTSGYDAYGTLGLGSGADLTGQSITAMFVVHGDAPGVTEPYDSPVVSSLFGAGSLSATILLAGRTFQIGGHHSDTYLYQYDDPGSTVLLDLDVIDSQCSSIRCVVSHATAHADGGAFLHGADWRDLPGTNLGAALYRAGSFYAADYGSGADSDIYVNFDWNRATIPVPEPGVWALMILGFGFTGAALRRRRGALEPGHQGAGRRP